jgi:hypothetical protein
MPWDKHTILGVHLTDRVREALDVQRLLTEYGSNIKTRLGLHEVEKGFSAPNGLILLEMHGDAERIELLVKGLRQIEGVEVDSMVFEHPER